MIGLGNVGSKVANIALSFGMKVIGYDPGLSANTAWRVDRHITHAKSVEEVLKESDYVTVHIPYTEKNHHFIDADKLAMMKDNAALINFSRGGIVDDEAAVAALNADKLRMFITDFSNDVLFDSDKVIITPHIGGSTVEAEDTSALMAAKQLDDYLTTGNIVNSVNYPDINEPFTSKYRLGVFHNNVPNMIGQITKVVGELNLNIEELSNRAVGDYAYTLLALNQLPKGQEENIADNLAAIENVLNVELYQNPDLNKEK